MIFIRSTLFNFAFYGITGIACILCLPALLLPYSRFKQLMMAFINSVYFLEKHILNLDYEVRGLEYLPNDKTVIIAAKHQSPYETLKLHKLCDFPAVIMKKELLDIPLWGWFLSRSGPIAIDRTKKREATNQIIEGALRVKEQGRPIIIFPQGTRVHPWETPEDKPYKSGVTRMYEKTDLAIVPLALNSGLYWPRRSWVKKPGKVIFEFLPPIEPGKQPNEVLKKLEVTIERKTKELQQEALDENPFLIDPEELKQAL